MTTDDILADLGAQLRAAEPRRNLRPLVALALLAVLAVAALMLVPRGEEREPAAPVTGTAPRVAVLNGTTIPGYATRTVAGLRRAGYRVLAPTNDPEPGAPLTMVGATDPRFAAQARQLRRRLGAAPLTPNARRGAVDARADVVVVLGTDGALPPLAATLPRVRVVNQSGSADWGHRVAARLRARGATVTELAEAGRAFRTRVVPLGPDPGPAAEAAAAIGRPGDVSPRGSSPDGGSANTVVFLGSDLPGATLLESALAAASGSCQPATPDGAGRCIGATTSKAVTTGCE